MSWHGAATCTKRGQGDAEEQGKENKKELEEAEMEGRRWPNTSIETSNERRYQQAWFARMFLMTYAGHRSSGFREKTEQQYCNHVGVFFRSLFSLYFFGGHLGFLCPAKCRIYM